MFYHDHDRDPDHDRDRDRDFSIMLGFTSDSLAYPNQRALLS